MIPQHGKRFHVLIKIFESANAGDEDQTTSFKTNFIISLGLETLTPVATQQIEGGGDPASMGERQYGFEFTRLVPASPVIGHPYLIRTNSD